MQYHHMKALVLDSDVLVAAFRSDRGASRVLLEWARARRFELLLSVPLVLEYEAVLTRTENLVASRVDRDEVSALLDELASVCRRVEIVIRSRPTLSDPDDEMVLETAINGSADAIVTFNERDFKAVASKWSCAVMRPQEIIRKLYVERSNWK
jgi:putative PIN family toxin of toxin-antitoxin system